MDIHKKIIIIIDPIVAYKGTHCIRIAYKGYVDTQGYYNWNIKEFKGKPLKVLLLHSLLVCCNKSYLTIHTNNKSMAHHMGIYSRDTKK